MKTILIFIMLIISTVTFSQTYNYSSNGYSTTVTVVGRNVYTLTSSPSERGTISNRKMKKIEEEQKKRKEETKKKENKMYEAIKLTKDSIEHFVVLRDSINSIFKKELIKIYNDYPSDDVTRKNMIDKLRTTHNLKREIIDDEINILCDKGVNLISKLVKSSFRIDNDIEKVYEYIREHWRKSGGLKRQFPRNI